MDSSKLWEFPPELTRKSSIGTLLGTEFISAGIRRERLVPVSGTHHPFRQIAQIIGEEKASGRKANIHQTGILKRQAKCEVR